MNIGQNTYGRFKGLIASIPLLFGLISLALGADTNWDLTNYHIYNPFAWLNNKLTTDLAPAGLQTYFNPLLDLPYFWMASHLPASLVGFIMGLFHGFNFCLVALIAQKYLTQQKIQNPKKLSIILAVFGCLTANFVSEIGTTMGDASTSIFVLTGVYFALLSSEYNNRAQLAAVLVAGVLLGAATGLKLINACFALALCFSLFLTPGPVFKRIGSSAIYSLGVAIGLAATGGWWFIHMYELFGNPLFPQYSALFPHELTQNIMDTNSRWGLKHWWEILFWPLIIAINPLRTGELNIHQFIWPAFYFACLIFILKATLNSTIVVQWKNRTFANTLIIGFIWLGFIISTLIFGVQRYLIALELLVPTCLYLTVVKIFKPYTGHKFALMLLLILEAINILTIPRNWGHASWAQKMFRLEIPAKISAAKDTVIFAGGDQPLGWMATQFQPELAFIQIGSNFPENHSNYTTKVHSILKHRKGDIFAIFYAAKKPTRVQRANQLDKLVSYTGINAGAEGCKLLAQSIRLLHLQNKLKIVDDLNRPSACHISANIADLPPELEDNNLLISSASSLLSRYKLSLEVTSCSVKSAYIGSENFPYFWCKVNLLR